MIPLPDNLQKAKTALSTLLPAGNNKNGFTQELESNGLGLQAIAQNVSLIANFAADESLKLKANELAMRAFDVLKDTADGKSVTINIQILDSNVDIIDLCTPRG